MLDFRPYSIEELENIQEYLDKDNSLCCDLTIGFMFMWNEDADMRFCVWNDTFIMRQIVGEQVAFSWPIGKDPNGMIDELLSYVKENGLPLRFFAIDDLTLDIMKDDPRLSPFKHAYDPRWSDYIYDYESAMTFKGKRFGGQRNHINHFKRLYGEPDIRIIDPRDKSLDDFFSRYEKEHEDANKLEKMELLQTKKLLDMSKRFGLFDACLFVKDEMIAISIGEVINNTLYIHVEKALKEYPGAYPVMYNGFLRLVRELTGRPLKYINREDDSGDPGLRTSKQQYQPLGMVNKHLVHVATPALKLKDLPVLKNDGVCLTPFYEKDRHDYYVLNTDVINNRFWGYDYTQDLYITDPKDNDIFYDSLLYDMAVGDSLNFAIRLSPEGKMIGEALLWQFNSNGEAELGCRLLKRYQGRGHGQKAFAMLADLAEREMGLKVNARCYKQNVASRLMILHSGFKQIGEDEDFYYFKR